MHTLFMTAQEVSDVAGIGISKAYAIIRRLNEEQAKQGYLTINGRVNRRYFYEKCYNVAVPDE